LLQYAVTGEQKYLVKLNMTNKLKEMWTLTNQIEIEEKKSESNFQKFVKTELPLIQSRL